MSATTNRGGEPARGPERPAGESQKFCHHQPGRFGPPPPPEILLRHKHNRRRDCASGHYYSFPAFYPTSAAGPPWGRVSGYFDKRERLWTEPIYRNLFGLLREFGDAELAWLVVPRSLIIEHARAPQIEGPPAGRTGAPARLGASASPGRIVTPVFADVADEFARARELPEDERARIEGRLFG